MNCERLRRGVTLEPLIVYPKGKYKLPISCNGQGVDAMLSFLLDLQYVYIHAHRNVYFVLVNINLVNEFASFKCRIYQQAC